MAVEPQRTLTDLPFEVLDLIFMALACEPRYRYFEDSVYHWTKDKLSLAETSEYLGQAFAYHSRDVYKEALFNIGPCISDRNCNVILPLCGSTMDRYNSNFGFGWNAEVAKAVAQYCPNLQEVNLTVDSNRVELLLAVVNKAKNAIRRLELRTDINFMQKMPDLPQLTFLKLVRFPVDEAYEIHRFANIEELFLQSPQSPGTNTKPINLFKVCSHLKKLRLLTMITVYIISETDENEKILECPALEHFTMKTSFFSMEFPSFPKLKVLEILCGERSYEGLVYRSVVKQSPDLERLVMDIHPSQINNKTLLEVIRKHRKLRYINVPIRKIKFDLGFVIELVNALRENGVTEEDPLELVVDKISKIHWLRHWLSYISAPKLIKITEFRKT